MSINALEDISFRKKEVDGSINTVKTLIFKHEASAGDLIIDTTSVVAPASSTSNGFVQPSTAEIASLRLLTNKKNLKIHSSRGAWLQLYDDFVVTGQNTIQFVGNLETLGGALEGEIFTIYATPIQTNMLLTTDSKRAYQEYVLAEGETVLNLGREYEVGRNLVISQIGALRVFRNGVGPQLRNVANALAAPAADGNFQEIDAGNGLGTQIEFNVAPVGQDDVIVVEFGMEYAGDFSMVGDIEALYGAVLKLADDVKDLGPFPISRYLTANPSEVERRGFGNLVQQTVNDLLAVDSRLTAIEGQAVSGASGFFDIGNLRIQWGSFLQNAGAAVDQTQNLVVPFASASYRVFLQSTNQNNVTSRATPLNASQFTVQIGVAGTPTINFLAIGVKP